MTLKAISINPVARAILVIGAVMALVTSVTLAAVDDQVVLDDNTIASANADLKIWNFDLNDWAETAPGFQVTGLVPGAGSDEYDFYLLNDSDTDLNLTATVPAEPAVPVGGYGFTGWENLEVTFKGYAPECDDALTVGVDESVVKTDMAALLAGEVDLPCNPLDVDAQGDGSPGAEETEGNYSVKFDIDPTSVTPGGSPGVGAFDIVIDGTLVTVAP